MCQPLRPSGAVHSLTYSFQETSSSPASILTHILTHPTGTPKTETLKWVSAAWVLTSIENSAILEQKQGKSKGKNK